MRTIIITGLVFANVFWLYPGFDIWFSSLFYSADEGFIYKESDLVEFVYNLVPFLTYFIATFLIFSLLGNLLKIKTRILPKNLWLLPAKSSFFLLVVLIVGPGVLVHNGLKEFLERPRPKHIIEFGGTENYKLPFEYSPDASGKSFVSGHAAMGFYFSSIGLLLTGRKRKVVYAGGVIAGVIVGFGRILQGKHFLSDVVFSGIFTLLVAHLVFHFMFLRKTGGKSIKHPE